MSYYQAAPLDLKDTASIAGGSALLVGLVEYMFLNSVTAGTSDVSYFSYLSTMGVATLASTAVATVGYESYVRQVDMRTAATRGIIIGGGTILYFMLIDPLVFDMLAAQDQSGGSTVSAGEKALYTALSAFLSVTASVYTMKFLID